MNLEYFIDNVMKKDTMDVEIIHTLGYLITDPKYEEYEVIDVYYENRIATIIVDAFAPTYLN